MSTKNTNPKIKLFGSNLIPRTKGRYDLTNIRFEKLIARKLAYSSKNNRFWHCECDCGKKQEIVRKRLENGLTKSCWTCYVRLRKTYECKNCGCRSHKNIDWDTNECELMGFCIKCDGYKHQLNYI